MESKESHFFPLQNFACEGLRKAKIGIYAGKGASHSWLWFVDLFQKKGFLNLSFLDEELIRQKDYLKALDVLIVSGGDTFAVAEALKKDGAYQIQCFVENGGIYIGSCAGAYLPMNSSKEPLNLFNFVNVKITNLAKVLPETLRQSYKSFVLYGCDYLFHPVREAVKLKVANNLYENDVIEFNAPLYGGPGMTYDHPEHIVAYYDGFTNKTSFLVNRETAERTLIRKAAVIRVPYNKGCFYLMGPHLEHPDYKDANDFLTNVLLGELSESLRKAPQHHLSHQKKASNLQVVSGQAASKIIRNMKSELSNSRIAASGLEFVSVSWLIGKKVYAPDKIRVFLESMWKRIKLLEKIEKLVARPGMLSFIVGNMGYLSTDLRQIKNAVDQNIETLDLAVCMFERLQKVSINFFDVVFKSLRESQL